MSERGFTNRVKEKAKIALVVWIRIGCIRINSVIVVFNTDRNRYKLVCMLHAYIYKHKYVCVCAYFLVLSTKSV